jgi:hypothetical protein
MWTPNAFYYDFGRPFPPENVRALLFGCKELFKRADKDSTLQVYEPGVGTGRILIPLAQTMPKWIFIGSEISNSMSDVFDYKVVVNNVPNANVIRTDAFLYTAENRNDVIIISSLLHTIKNWSGLMFHILKSLPDDSGYICLIGEQGDVYDCALGRVVEGADGTLCKFWKTYRDTRAMFIRNDDLERSQVGIKWEPENEEVAQYLLAQGLREIDVNRVSWNQQFRVSDLVKLLEERCYSSMFTVETSDFDKVVSTVKSKAWELETYVVSRHRAVVRCFAKIQR